MRREERESGLGRASCDSTVSRPTWKRVTPTLSQRMHAAFRDRLSAQPHDGYNILLPPLIGRMLFDNCGIEPAVPKPDIDKVTRSDGVKVLRQSASVPCFHPAAIGAPRPAYLPWRRQNQSQSAALIMRAPPPMPRCAHSCSLVSAQQHVYSTRTRTHVHSHVHV